MLAGGRSDVRHHSHIANVEEQAHDHDSNARHRPSLLARIRAARLRGIRRHHGRPRSRKTPRRRDTVFANRLVATYGHDAGPLDAPRLWSVGGGGKSHGCAHRAHRLSSTRGLPRFRARLHARTHTLGTRLRARRRRRGTRVRARGTRPHQHRQRDQAGERRIDTRGAVLGRCVRRRGRILRKTLAGLPISVARAPRAISRAAGVCYSLLDRAQRVTRRIFPREEFHVRSASFHLTRSCALALVLTSSAAIQARAQITRTEYSARRDSLAARVDSGIVIAFGARTPVTDFGPFYQLASFRYLTGYQQPDAAFVMVIRGGRQTTTLFTTPVNPHLAFYYGFRPDSSQIARDNGLTARPFAALAPLMDSLAATGLPVYAIRDVADDDFAAADSLTRGQQFMKMYSTAHSSMTIQDGE